MTIARNPGRESEVLPTFLLVQQLREERAAARPDPDPKLEKTHTTAAAAAAAAATTTITIITTTTTIIIIITITTTTSTIRFTTTFGERTVQRILKHVENQHFRGHRAIGESPR
eukprot:36307-Heterocapsa_arctica.AAC.1